MPEVAGSGRRKPWHKPALYDLTELSRISGSPTNKQYPYPALAEDESRPEPTRAKKYRPISA